MNRHRLAARLVAGLIVSAAIATFAFARERESRSINGTIWAANRGAHTIRAFDADTGAVVRTVDMAPNSQPGDLAAAKGKLYVAEESGTPPAIAIVDTHNDTLVGIWDSNPRTTNARIHAAVFSNDDSTVYLASDATNEVIAMDPRNGDVFWRLPVPGAHELAVTHNQRLLYISRRTPNQLSVIRLDNDRTTAPTGFEDVLAIALPDTLRLTANEDVMTVGLRTMPARLAIVHLRSLDVEFVNLAAPGDTTSVGGHQWTSENGRYTLAAFEGGSNPGVAVIDHKAGHQVLQTLSYPGRPHGVEHTHP